MPELRLASLLDTASDPMLIAATDGSVLFFNKAFETLLGYASAQMVGRNVRSLFPAMDQDGLGGDLAAVVGPFRSHRNVRVRARDGREFTAEIALSAAPTPAGRQYLMVVRQPATGEADPAVNIGEADVTRVARQSALEEIGSAIAHKLNQPLTAVILYLQAIGRAYDRETAGSRLPDAVAAILEKAVHEAERASGMLQALRLRPGFDDGRPQLTDINQVLEDAIDLVGVRVRAGLQIDRDLAPRLPPVQVARFELQQALISLIRAALDEVRGRDGGGIRLTTCCSLGQVAVLVDSDAVAAGEFADNCAASTNGRRNCEKDLAIARAIAQSHGGNLVVDADGRDRGARFTLRLPVPAGSASSA